MLSDQYRLIDSRIKRRVIDFDDAVEDIVMDHPVFGTRRALTDRVSPAVEFEFGVAMWTSWGRKVDHPAHPVTLSGETFRQCVPHERVDVVVFVAIDAV